MKQSPRNIMDDGQAQSTDCKGLWDTGNQARDVDRIIKLPPVTRTGLDTLKKYNYVNFQIKWKIHCAEKLAQFPTFSMLS